MKLTHLLTLLLFVSCSTTKPVSFHRTGEVECVDKGRTSISLIASGQAHTKDIAYEYAVRNAFENLLFKGIPDSNQEKPLVANEHESLKMKSSFYDDLLIKREYQKFIMHSELRNSSGKSGSYQSSVFLKIDLGALKVHLEQNDITRKFGL